MGLAAAKTAAPAAAETLDTQARRVSVRPAEAVLARKSCECGAAAGLSGRCDSCAGVSLHMPHGQTLGGSWRASEPPAAQGTPPPAAPHFALRDLRASPAPALKTLIAQTQLRVASAGDSAEIEAQEMGRRIIAMPAPAPPQEPGGEAHSNLSPVRRVISGAVQRRAIQPMMASPGVVRGIESTRSGGAPLPSPLRNFMEPRFGADFSSVRVHAGPEAATLSSQLNAHAFTIGRDIYFNDGQFRPETDAGRELIAHELTHTIQQGGAIQRAAAEAPVSERSGESVQRSIWDDIKSGAAGIVNALGDPLAFLADKANIIPGFRLLTIVLGANPITMAKVDPTPANILMAMIEFIPGGGLVTQALQGSGVFDKVGNWIAGKIKALVATVGALKTAVTTFIGSLQAADIANPGGVWERAKRIFTEPIGQLIAFCKGVVIDILKFIKDAILLPLAKLAEGTPSWDILCAVLGTNPVTGEAVEAKPEVLIGGFMKLIGQEEIWQNMQKANAIPRAFAWFKGAYGAVKAFVTAIPGKFKELFSSLTIEDVVLVAGAFKKVASVFGGFVGNFISWGLNAAWNLLEIIFDVVSPGAFAYVKKTGAALHDILKNPLPFVGNLIKAAKLGFTNFASNIGDHLKAGLIDWLTGSLPGVYIPKAFSLPEFGKLAISVLGLSWAQIRAKIVKALGPRGETIMKGLELAFDVVKALVTGGVAAAWELVKEKLTGLKDMVVDAIIGFVKSAIIEKAIPKLIAMFIPGAGFISAIVSIYDTIKVFIEKLEKIAAVVKSFVDSIVAIAAGEIGGAAKRVEGALGGLLSLAISFFAGFVGLGNVASKIQEAIKKVWDMVDKGLDIAIGFIVGKAKALFAYLFGGGKDDDKDKKPAQGAVPDQVKEFSMMGAGHRLTITMHPDGVDVRMASAEGALLQKVREEITTQEGIISALPPADTELIAYHTGAKDALSGIVTWYGAERLRINGLRASKTPAELQTLMRELGEGLAQRIIAVSAKYRLDDFVRKTFNVKATLESIRAQVEDQIEKHADNPAAVGDRMAYTAAAAEMYLGWLAKSGQRHVDKVSIAMRVIDAALKDLDQLEKGGINMQGERWYVRGKNVLAQCNSAISAPDSYVWARGAGVVKAFIDDMDARGVKGNGSAVADAKRRLGMK
jgi:hypothetical protein